MSAVTSRAELDVEGLPPELDELGPEPAPLPLETPAAAAAHEGGAFARRVASVFSTQVTLFVLAFATSFLAARILGKDGKGAYGAITTFPAFLSAFAMLGLPSAVNYFAGRGVTLGSLIRISYALTAVLAGIALLVVWIALPVFETSILSGAAGYDDMLRLILVTIPFSFLTAFGGSILYGRQAVKRYNLIQLATAAFTLVWIVVTLGILHHGVRYAVAGSVIVSIATTVLVMATVHRLDRSATTQPMSLRRLAGYSARTYPANLSGYFSYRADTYILQAVDASATSGSAGPYGLYTMAVTMAEVLFYVPNAVATLFLPRVAGATVEESSVMVGRVGRITTLITVAAAIALAPAGVLAIHLILPDFVDCLPAFLVLLPGVVSLSVGKVMTSFIGGRGRPGTIAAGSMISVGLNVALNLVFIPAFGIVGASAASLVSYTVQAAIAVFFAARISGKPPLSLFVPGRAEVALLIETLPRLLHGVPVLGRLPAVRARG